MKMQPLTILLTILVVSAQGGDDPPPPPLCCVADQWTVTEIHSFVNSIGGEFEFGKVVNNLAYDAINQREVYRTTRTDNLDSSVNIDYYLLFQQQMMYIYYNETDTCIKQNLTNPFNVRCVPGDAYIVDDELYYGRGERNITAYRAMFYVPRKAGNFLSINLAITEDCIPLVEKFQIISNDGTDLMTETAEFTNMVIASIPEDVFDLPPACCNAEYGVPERYPSIAFDI